MIKALIFDFFGVLANEGTVSFAKTYYPNDKEKLTRTYQLQDKLNLAVLTYREYVDELAKLSGVDGAEVIRHLESHQANDQLLGYIREQLKPKYKIGMLSNAGGDWAYEILSKEDIALFDDIVLSYKTGFIKPEPEIYRLALENLGVRPSESVFVDDVQRYCEGAEELGIRAVLYRDFEQMKAELEKMLVGSADN